MYEVLKPCGHRQVDNGGRILCGLMRGGDNEVSLDLCHACPVPEIDCQHLRATMVKELPTPITVRYSTGRTEVWNNEAPAIHFKHAACAEKTIPIHSPHDCTGCPLRSPMSLPLATLAITRKTRSIEMPLAVADSLSTARSAAARESQPMRYGHASMPAPAKPTAEPSGENKSKIILLQQWLREQFAKKDPSSKLPAAKAQPDSSGVSDIAYSPAGTSYEEQAPGLERCVGWTD